MFLVAFGLFEIAVLFDAPALAFSLFSCLCAGVALLGTGRLMWDVRAGLRREFICASGILELGRALEAQDYEGAVGALSEWNHHFEHEVAKQDSNPWSLFRFWQLPPRIGSEWS